MNVLWIGYDEMNKKAFAFLGRREFRSRRIRIRSIIW